MHDAVDEQRRCASDLARRKPALDVTSDPAQRAGAGSVVVELCDVEFELGCMAPQVVVFERLLAMEEQVVHVPEAVLERGCLGGGGRCEGVGMDLCEREVPEGEANAIGELSFNPLDRAERLPRVGAFVVAVLDDETSGGWAANVIDLLVERLHGRLAFLWHRVSASQKPTDCRMRTTWTRPGSSWWISRTLPTRLFCP